VESTTGIKLAQIEGTGIASANITTPHVVNSCSSNSSSGITVCTSNLSDVYVINGTTVTTLTDSANTNPGTSISFSGGSCSTCGVTVDPTANFAIIGLESSGPPGGFQLLNLANNTFGSFFSAQTSEISESFASDPTRHLVLSASEPTSGPTDYQIINISNPAAPQIFNFANASTVFGSSELDSAAADCSTGIALASDEFTTNLFIADLTQATFTPGTGTAPGTWNAPSQLQSLPQFSSFGAGTTGITVVSGAHVGLLEDEFGTTAFGAIQLPATSGTGTPAIQDWVVANMPNDPSGAGWTMSLDPHGLTAYTSPTTGQALGLIMNRSRTFIAVVDIKALLAAERSPAHTVAPSVDLVATKVVRFVALPASPP
jgi:hypothetical protein